VLAGDVLPGARLRPAGDGAFAGRENVLLAPEGAQAEVRNQTGMGMGMIAGLAWPGCLRKLDRECPATRTDA
jgi:hypothetical protein